LASGTGYPLILLGLAWLLAGCASTPPPPIAPPAVTHARQRIADAERLAQQEHWSAAANAWRDAAERFALLDAPIDQAYALHGWARVCRELGDPARAHLLLEESASLYHGKTAAAPPGWWLVQIELVQVEFLMRQTNAARLRLYQLAPQLPAVADPNIRGLVLNELGLDQQRQGIFAAATLSYQQAHAAFQKAKSEAGLAAVDCNQAQLHFAQDQPEMAVAYWQQALVRYRTLGDTRRIAFCLMGLGQSLLATGQDLTAAEKALRQAADNYRLLQHRPGLIRSLESLASCLQQQAKDAEAAAVRHDREALRRNESFGPD
jgi:tetratricopeptide (TPR) repeat protein